MLIKKYKEIINKYILHLAENKKISNIENFSSIIKYVLLLPGKRIRPILCLLITDLYNKNKLENSIKPSIAIELFHNFTLIHDDIIDNSLLRRGYKTINNKWDNNNAILVGDLLYAKSYSLFEDLNPKIFYLIIKEFTNMGIKICEGQKMDMNLSLRNNNKYNIKYYFKMISYKTGCLIGTTMKIGAIIAIEKKNDDTKLLYKIGKNIGIYFQLKDDYFDFFKKKKDFKKDFAKDIIENKRTILYFLAIKIADKKDKNIIENLYKKKIKDIKYKINIITKIFKKINIKNEFTKIIEKYNKKIFYYIDKLSLNNENKNKIREIINYLDKIII